MTDLPKSPNQEAVDTTSGARNVPGVEHEQLVASASQEDIPRASVASPLSAPSVQAAAEAEAMAGQQRPPVPLSIHEPASGWAIFWREWMRPFLIILFAMTTFRSAIADWNRVPSGSMEPTILIGDHIFVNKVAYDLKVPFTLYRLAEWGHPPRGYVIFFRSPADNKRLVKRVIGLPGDEIRLLRNKLYVNDEPADYEEIDSEELPDISAREIAEHQYALELLDDAPSHPIKTTPWRPRKSSFEPIEIPPGHYFVMGDNRDESFDSRWFGVVAEDLILGRAIGVAMSVDPDRYYKPRWNRFFSGLP
jgi:signal peptidase I